MASSPYEVGVYYFPGYHPDPLVSQWHGQAGWTEWELLRQAKPRFANHQQPKVPLWGYGDESNVAEMTLKADSAAAHGINHFLFDWYHYEGREFLNGALDRGFLAIPGGPPIKFALMWANHDWLDIQPARPDGNNPRLLRGTVSYAELKVIVELLVERYFSHPQYWRIGGRCYFSIYDLPALIRGLGGIWEARAALDYLRDRTQRAGLGDVHLNLVHWQHTIVGSAATDLSPEAITRKLGFDSISSYVWIHHYNRFQFPVTAYRDVMRANVSYWESTAAAFECPYFPNVTMGWDTSPRTNQAEPFVNGNYPYMATLRDNTPSNFREALLAAKSFVDNHALPVKHVSINAWNEWTEGSYLEPDRINGFGYLEAIRDVFGTSANAPVLPNRSSTPC
jgi:hypothetical protein